MNADSRLALPRPFAPIKTDRLILRPFTDADLESFLKYRSAPEVCRYQSWTTFSRNDAIAFLAEMKAAKFGVSGKWYQIAIANRESNLLIGDIGSFIPPERPGTMELGFTIAPEFHRQGYAKEALSCLIHWLFKDDFVASFTCIADSRNISSLALLQSLGMTFTSAETAEFKGETCIEHTYRLFKEDWQTHPSR